MSVDKNAVQESAPPVPARAKTDVLPAGGFAHWPVCGAVFLTFLILDHATKYWAITALKPAGYDASRLTQEMYDRAPVVTILPGLLDLRYAENTGMAFSMFLGKTMMLGVVSLIATALLVYFWRSLPAREIIGRLAVASILSGAVANMIDRFARNYVVDFIHAFWHDHHWPTFNIADSCICVGACVLAVQLLRGKI
ncbi:signal peptidase II [soil metagenome]